VVSSPGRAPPRGDEQRHVSRLKDPAFGPVAVNGYCGIEAAG